MNEILFCILCPAAAYLAGKLLLAALRADKTDFDAAVEAMRRTNCLRNNIPITVVTRSQRGE